MAKLHHNQATVVVVAGDNIGHCFYEKILRRDASVRVVSVRDGFSGLAHIAENKPALIIAELGLPGFEIISMIRILRKDLVFKSTPMVVVADMSRQEICAEVLMLDLERVVCIPKSVNLAALENAILRCLPLECVRKSIRFGGEVHGIEVRIADGRVGA